MTLIIVDRKFAEQNIEAACQACCSVAAGLLPDAELGAQVFECEGIGAQVQIICRNREDLVAEPVLIVPIPLPKLFTWLDPTDTIEYLRPLFRGALRSAISIWSKDRKYGADFDLGGIFYRRPYLAQSTFFHQTLVIFDVPHHLGETIRPGRQDLAVVAFGQSDEGLPRLEEFRHKNEAWLKPFLKDVELALRELGSGAITVRRQANAYVPIATTLEGVRVPGWYSYDQWMRRLDGTQQGEFIKFPVTGPLRVDGPAGTGKTLSLVLKCLYTLKSARTEQRKHRAALVVFSEETKRKILDDFLVPLDEDNFSGVSDDPSAAQSLTVTTLLEWSKRELEPVVGAFELPSANAAQARTDQRALVKDVLDQNLHSFLKGGGTALSRELRELCEHGPTPILIEMFVHEFGVVIKGIADGSLRRYLTISRPAIALPCRNEPDRRFIFALFEKYEMLLREYGVVDLDDVAVSHIKLLQMPLRREQREERAFDSVFVDEAHSFNPNELAIFFLLTRRAELPPLVVAVDLPQGLGDKGYKNEGFERALFEQVEAREHLHLKPFVLEDVRRCPQAVLDLVGSIYAQGHNFMAPVAVPKAIRSTRTDKTPAPVARPFGSEKEMLEGVFASAESMVERLKCARSEVLIVLMHDGLEKSIPKGMSAKAEMLSKRTDYDAELRAQKLNHYVIARPEYLHGLEFDAVIVAGASRDEIPRVEQVPLGGGAAAVFETQRVVDLLYLALTRARREVEICYVKAPSFLLTSALQTGLLRLQTT